eukprot:scaffold517_cov119-Cylindrotheca_fusiformis.AAC.40
MVQKLRWIFRSTSEGFAIPPPISSPQQVRALVDYFFFDEALSNKNTSNLVNRRKNVTMASEKTPLMNKVGKDDEVDAEMFRRLKAYQP